MKNFKDNFDHFIKTLEDKNLNVIEVLVYNDGEIFSKDTDKEKLYEVYSLSKAVTGLAVFKAIELGLLSLESNVLEVLHDVKIETQENLPFLKELKIKHLLTLTLGQETSIGSEKWLKENTHITDYVSAIFNYPFSHKPGTAFFYNNACNYLCWAVLDKITGGKNQDFVNKNFFHPLGITKWTWRACPKGIYLGGTGLALSKSDTLKIAKLLLDDGKYKDKQIFLQEHIKSMKETRVPREVVQYTYQSKVFPKYAYGYNLWLTDDGCYFADGKYGQYIMTIPKSKTIIIAFSFVEPEQMREVVNCMHVFKD